MKPTIEQEMKRFNASKHRRVGDYIDWLDSTGSILGSSNINYLRHE